MRIRVVKAFAFAGRVYRPGVYPLYADLKDDVDELARMGWIIVVNDRDEVIPPLETPETGQHILHR